MKTICLAAILCEEEKFIDEWLVYHRLLGIEHFFLYDDSPALPLARFLQPHAAYVTVIPWHNRHQHLPGRNRQTKAYTHAVQEFSNEFEWITFIDGDEFIVLREHNSIPEFLAEFDGFDSVSLNWHVFGHNGYFDDPPGLITESLIKRMAAPSWNVKSITRSKEISHIPGAHYCKLKSGYMVDANQVPFQDGVYEGKSEIAHINHYQCRSFMNWMGRAKRGAVDIDTPADSTEINAWRLLEDGCLKQFVTSIAKDKNEIIDSYMKKYTQPILDALNKLEKRAPHVRLISR